MKTPFNRTGAAWRGCLFFASCTLLTALAPFTGHLALAQEPEAPTRKTAAPFRTPDSVTARHWMVVTANPYASEAAAAMLRKGGHATDAAIAAQWVLNLVEPQSSGIGGGGFMLVWNQRAQTLQAWDGRETAPALARADDYLSAEGKPLAFADIIREGKAVGVPGLVALLAQTHSQHGRLPWADLFEPAIRLAETGFFVSPRLQALLENDRLLRDDAHAAALYYPDDKPVEAGQFIRNPALAQTLRKLANGGTRAFYEGDMPRQIIAAIRGKTGAPTRLNEQDFRDYRAIQRAAICAPVRSHQVCGMPPPSAGGIAVLQMLQLLDLQRGSTQFPVLDVSGTTPHWQTAALQPWLIASRLAYEDRLRHTGDPDRVDVPVSRLISRTYLQSRLSAFQLSQTEPAGADRTSTTHVSIVDADGNAVSLTSSIEDQFGSRIMVNGFLLNNQLTDFDLKPANDATGSPNAFEPGKRPRSSMAPTLVLSLEQPRRIVAVIGSPGGPQIPSFIASRLYARWWGGHTAAQALASPHVTLRESRLDIESSLWTPQRLQALRDTLPAGPGRDNLPVNATPQTSGVHWIERTPQGWLGVADPRREGMAIGQ